MPEQIRKLQDGWLPAYRRYIIKQESPDIFHFWVGYQMIAASLKRHVWINRGAYNVYPNQYVFLIAKSGRSRKSGAMDIGLDLIKDVEDIRIIYGRMTVEGLIDQMNHASMGPDGRIAPDGSLLIQADELVYIFGKASYTTDLLDFFTAAYTSKARLDFLTRNKGLCTVRNPCPTLLSASTPEQMGVIFPSLTLVSGFMARTLLVYGGKKGPRYAKPILNHAMEDSLIHDLGCISRLYGEVKMTEESETFFDYWYEHMEDAPSAELASFYERRHDHVLKAALVLSVSESSQMIIEKKHIEAGIEAISYVESFYPKAVTFVGATTQSTIADFMLSILRTVAPHTMSHSVLLRRVYRKLTHGSEEFIGYIEDLKDQGFIEESVDGKSIHYKIKS